MSYNVPKAVKTKAARATKEGVKILVTPKELVERMSAADKALNGDSNDAEHDALFDLREWLSEVFEDPARRKS